MPSVENSQNSLPEISPEFWLILQLNYEIAMLDYTGRKDEIRKEIREVTKA
jgi:plasmid maintenance system antidote protein VapI